MVTSGKVVRPVLRRRRWLAVPAVVAVMVAAGGVALAAIPGPGGVLSGCYSKKTGGLRLIDPSKGQKCAAGEGAVSWNQAGITWRGFWSATRSYQAGDAVASGGSSYLAVKDSAGKAPAANPADWALLAARGITGPTGPTGPTGESQLPDPAQIGELDWWGGNYSAPGYGFDHLSGLAFDGTHLWVGNLDGNSVTEINASDGSLVRVLSASKYSFDEPVALAFDGTHVWVSNLDGNSVTEINASDGSLVRVLSASKYSFDQPAAMAFDGTHLWITNADDSVTEINASSGAFVRNLSFENPVNKSPAIAFDGTHLWITNYTGDTVTEINASNGSLVRVLSGGSYHFNLPAGIAFDGTHLWITNNAGNSVTEINASDGSFVQNLSGGDYNFNDPNGIAFDGTHLWIADPGNNSLTDIPS